MLFWGDGMQVPNSVILTPDAGKVRLELTRKAFRQYALTVRSVTYYGLFPKTFWYPRQDSNLRPMVPQTIALIQLSYEDT